MKNEEMKASDVLVKNVIDEKKKDLNLAKEIEEDKTESIPSNYIEVKLSSLGQLGMPSMVHVRDYTYNEALMMAEIKEDNMTEGIIKILDNIIFEDLDMKKAHKQDVVEILLSIYGTWYSPVLEVFNYFVNEDLEEEEKKAKTNISVATIPINNIQTTPVKEGSKLPITFKSKDLNVQLILPRIGNDIVAWKFAVKKNLKTEVKIAESIKAVKNEKYTDKQMEDYEKFVSQRGKDFLKALQCQLIYSIDDEKLNTFSKQIEAIDKVSFSLWKKYNKVVKENFHFGVEEEVKFECSVIHKEIARRFRFQPIHFLPILDKEDDSRFEISFG